MSLSAKELIKRLETYAGNMTRDDRIAVYHHSDIDGIISGVLAAKAVERLRGKKINLHLTSESGFVEITPSIIKKLKDNNITKLICTDLIIDENPGTAKEAEKFAELLVIDHHPTYADLNSDRTVFIKSEKLDKRYYPAGKLAYDLFSRVVDISDLDWLAAGATLADGGYKDWKAFVDRIAGKYNCKVGKSLFAEGFYLKFIGISYARMLEKENECFDILYEAKNPNELPDLLSGYYAPENETGKWVRTFGKEAKFLSNDLVFYEFNPKYKVKSSVINLLSLKLPNKTLICIVPEGKYYSLSARRQDGKVAVNLLLAEAVKGLRDARAGGHRPAAGGLILKKDLKRFKENIIKLLRDPIIL